MENISQKTKIIALLLILIVIVGTIITFTTGLNFDLKYQNSNRIELHINKEFEISDVKQITDEVIGSDAIIQKIEVYEDSIGIIAKEITEEQKTSIVEKINEKYGTELSAEQIEIESIPNTRGRDIIKPYITPFIISTLIILAYMGIRYHKLGFVKTILKTSIVLVIAQLFLLSIFAITRIPVGIFTISIVLVMYFASLIGTTLNFEKKLAEKIEQEKQDIKEEEE